ncbi:poly rna polymerase cid14 [Stemphylium lycopersici]|uniref:polynucleotide adenylyltransferase n=1 Tax=Stemphylium lycopersici TaxID=183478 RepID=A0A364N3G9_STELY|nr:poly rna polymerase cid14 [Stemphylium lycopersici]RAR10847.1 poly rna polymerase cid14 [Stemphylium lycopersici]
MDEACQILNVGPGKMGNIELEAVTERFKRLFDLNDPKKGGNTFAPPHHTAINQPPPHTPISITPSFVSTLQTRYAMGDSYRPGRDRPPPLADRMTFGGGDGDSYRPGGERNGNRSQFTFESNHPAPRFPPSGPSAPRGPSGSAASRRRGRGGGARGSSRADGRNNANGFCRGGFKKAAPHERALLQHRDAGTPERALGVEADSNRFQNPEDLSDDDEADMDVESDDSEQGGSGNKPKAARTQVKRADGDSVPKWSNPDPYTALPPPDETTGKKTDFVKLIRKAKNQEAEKAAAHNSVVANDDFISFGDDDDAQDPAQGSLNEFNHIDSIVNRQEAAVAEHRAPRGPKANNKRKATVGGVVDEWRPVRGGNPTPWLTSAEPYAHLTSEPEKWLHNEILDFYDFVAPKPYEHEQRNRLVNRVNSALGQRRFPQENGRVLCFGSFPAGLYLPTADMDLVYVSDRFYNGGEPVVDMSQRGRHKSLLYKASSRLSQTGMSAGGCQVIHARVPIIKFKDSLTKLQVDISFENLSGVQAQATFADWKEQYPDMIYMVALLKQFLVMHGLNEVHTGGLGGFSIICLIVSYIQHSKKPENLGECFLGFLKYYGEFDLSRKRIQMHPPAIIEKTAYGIDNRPENDNLSIQDPNRPENNISGGSHKVQDVFDAFREAYYTLEDRMRATRAGQNIGPSILECVLGGNYETYLQQRAHLKSLNGNPITTALDQRIHQAQYWDDGWAQAMEEMIYAQINGTTIS